MNKEYPPNSIAVIGMATRVPGAKTVRQLWDVLKEERETVSHFSTEELRAYEFDPEVLEMDNYVHSRGVLDDIEMFDAGFFGYTPREALYTDPQQRIWLEVAWEALEKAGYSRTDCKEAIGVFAGYTNSNYLLYNILKNRTAIENYVRSRYSTDFLAMLNNTNTYLATKTSYKFDLKGPSINLQTACSTSLVAIVMATQSLLQFESDVCIAGGITISIPQITGHIYQEGAILSRDGHCRPFDADSCGTVFSSGVGAVVLKRLEDAVESRDNILAVIRGAAINNDGANKAGFTAPSVDGQAEAISMAHYIADIDPSTISYIEAHGTATPLGDPIEVAGLTKAFGKCGERGQFCGLGSVKSNIGHCDSAAGIAGFIKTVLALQHRQIPATLHYKKPNPNLDFSQTPFYVVDKLTDWKATDSPLRAGVSSFGVGGTNAHVVLEEAPEPEPSGPSRKHQLILLSAKTDASLNQMTSNLAAAVNDEAEMCLADAAWTLHKTRRQFSNRMFAVCDDATAACAEILTSYNGPLKGTAVAGETAPPLAFAFPGQGSHYYGMAEELAAAEPVFNAALAECCELANRHLDFDLSDIFSKRIDEATYAEKMGHNGIAQLAIFAYDYSMGKLWLSLGIKPDALLGHSLGEWPAACIAGVLSLEHAIEAVWHRGRLMQSVAGDGAALTVFAGPEELRPYLGDDIHLAAENAPKISLLSGTTQAIAECRERLDNAGIGFRALNINVAVHSPALDAVIGSFEELLSRLSFSKPNIPMISTATGTWLTDEQAVDPAFWARQMRAPVQFTSAITALWSGNDYLLLETGPGTALSALSKQQGDIAKGRTIISAIARKTERNEHKLVLSALGRLWANGVELSADLFYGNETRNLVDLPGYAFDRKSYWLDPPSFTGKEEETGVTAPQDTIATGGGDTATDTGASAEPHSAEESLLLGLFEDILGVPSISENDDFFDLGGDSLIGIQLIAALKKQYAIDFALKDLLEFSTVKTIAEYLRENGTPLKTNNAKGQTADTWSPLVKVAKGTKTTPLFCVAGIGGTVLELRHLAASVSRGDIPFYGLETRGVAGHTPHQTVFDIAKEHVETVLKHQPEGPYYIAGYSAGGVIAYEMAQQLTGAGHKIALLALLDGSSPTLRLRTDIERRAVAIARIAHNPRKNLKNMVRRRLERWRGPQEELSQFDLVSDATVNALKNYSPMPYEGDAVLFRTHKDLFVGDIRWTVDDHEGWQNLIRGKLTIVPVKGTHLTVCQIKENAEFLGERVREAYLEAEHAVSSSKQ